MNTFATRGKLISENINKDFIMEGSMLSDKNCFALNYYENGLLNETEWKLYNNWFNWLNTSLNIKSEDISYIYLRTDPKISYNRIKKRNRNEDELLENSNKLNKIGDCQEITLEYLTEIHKKHDDLLYKRAKNILILNGNKDIENNSVGLKSLKKIIKNFLLQRKYFLNRLKK